MGLIRILNNIIVVLCIQINVKTRKRKRRKKSVSNKSHSCTNTSFSESCRSWSEKYLFLSSECTPYQQAMWHHHHYRLETELNWCFTPQYTQSKEEMKTFKQEKTDKCQWPIIIMIRYHIIVVHHAMLSITYIYKVTCSPLIGRLKFVGALGVCAFSSTFDSNLTKTLPDTFST